MEDATDDEQQKNEVMIRRPFQPKFMRELNYMQNQKNKKNQKKLRSQKNISPRKMEKFEKIGISPLAKTNKKLPEMNKNGNKIKGMWKNNQLQGQAQIFYNNGVVFKGTYQKGIKVKGHFQFLHGYQYIGHCLGNKFDGQGSLFFPSGKIITGEWKDYNLAEKGKIEYANGEVYYGDIQDLKKHGKGYLFFKDGSKYVGQFEAGQITGFGTYYINDEPVTCGNWIDGELEETIDLSKIQSDEENNRPDPAVYNMRKSLNNLERSYDKRCESPKKTVRSKVEKKLRFVDTNHETFMSLQKSIPQL